MEEKTNSLLAKHIKLSSSEIDSLLKKYSLLDRNKLPQIKISDPAIADFDFQIGDVVEIARHSFAGRNNYYRVIVE